MIAGSTNAIPAGVRSATLPALFAARIARAKVASVKVARAVIPSPPVLVAWAGV
jgi:hypothetical protein